MNKKFRKLLSGVIYSVGIMSSLVCPCAQAKWGEGTHAMTDDEFNAFYKKFGLDVLSILKTILTSLTEKQTGQRIRL